MTSTPDARLIAAHDLARAALAEITPASTVGDAVGHTVEEDGSVSLRFANNLAGYPGWFWTVTVAVVEDAEPTVLELELLPGDEALLAPEWVPWAERLAEYRATMAAAEAAASDDDAVDDLDDDDLDDELDEDDDLDLDDLDDLDAVDFDEDGSPLLHSGDLDGVDIDELDDSGEEEPHDESHGFDEDVFSDPDDPDRDVADAVDKAGDLDGEAADEE